MRESSKPRVTDDGEIYISRREALSSKGNFFAVDLPTFDKVCALGDPDVAAAYLVLAAGTGADNRTSSWSREAINKRTSLNWRKADTAIGKLEAAGLVRWVAKSTRKTRIDLVPVDNRRPLSRSEKEIVEQVKTGKPVADRPYVIENAIASGHLSRGDDGVLICVEPKATTPVWLPKSLVGDELGRAEEDLTIVERIRKSRDVMAFHLLVHMAHRQDMAELRGVDRAILEIRFERDLVFKTANLDVIHFRRGSQWVSWNEHTIPHRIDGDSPASAFFERVALLEDAGAIEWTYFVAEDDKLDSIVLFPMALVRHSKLVYGVPETITGLYASAAGCALSDRTWQDWEALAPGSFLAPIDRMNRKAAMIGVPRLRGLAKTRNIARWQKERMIEYSLNVAAFRGILSDHPELLAELDQRFADFNGEFNDASTIVQRDINDSSQSVMHIPRPSDEGETGNKKAGML